MPTNTPNFKIPKPLGNEITNRASFNTILDVIDTNVAGMPTNAMARQAVINGNFDVWQRGTSLTYVDDTVQYLADRWWMYASKGTGAAPIITQSRQALTPGDIMNAYYCHRVNFAGAFTFTATAQHSVNQSIEQGTRYLCGEGKKITVSFWAKSDIIGKKIGLTAWQLYGTGGSTAENIPGPVIALTSTWKKYTVTFTTNALVGKTFGANNDDSFRITFHYGWGADFNARFIDGATENVSAAGNIDIAQVQVNVGDVALPFQSRSFADEESACQRYFRRMGFGAAGRFIAADRFAVYINFDRAMRVSPTITLNTTNPTVDEPGVATRTATGSTIISSASPTRIGVTATIGGFSATNGSLGFLSKNCFDFDAEI